MKRGAIYYLCALLVAGLLPACGGGGGESSSKSVATPVAVTTNPTTGATTTTVTSSVPSTAVVAATVTVPAGTVGTTVSGAVVRNPTLNLTTYNKTVDLPSGAASARTTSGLVFQTVGSMVSVSMVDASGNVVKTLSQPITVTLQLTSGETLGQVVPYYRFDTTLTPAQWVQEGTATVKAGPGGLVIDMLLTSLSDHGRCNFITGTTGGGGGT